MGRQELLVAAVAVLFAVAASSTAASPPRPGTEENGLTENESATLWSKDDDSRYVGNEEYREAYGDNRTAVHQVANATDLTFRRPPATASIWTRNDFRDYAHGDGNTSVYPSHARLENSTFIQDAHATLFSILPATRTHTTPNETTLYVAPDGSVYGTVDYRVRKPSPVETGNRTVTWTVQSHEITEVRLRRDGEVIERQPGTHTPVVPYQVGDEATTLTLEADIETRLARETRTVRIVNRTLPNGTARNGTEIVTNRTVVTDSVTVTDSIDVRGYHLDATFHYARYPDGDTGVAIFQGRPWQGYGLSGDGSERVRGVWRFYTARNTNWDTLIRSNSTGERRVESDALPVAVHAYPSTLGPRAEPTGDGPALIDVWGDSATSPAAGLHEHVHVDVVERPYEASYGVAVRSSRLDRGEVTIRGIVRGVTATRAVPSEDRKRQLRRSRLDAAVIDRDEDGATIRIELHDAETGEAIFLGGVGDPRFDPILDSERSGYITVGDRRVRTNSSGMATVRVTESGIYSVEYHPGSWLSHDPAYVRDKTAVRWHPLTTIDGWVALGMGALQWFLPFLAALYAGRMLGRMVKRRGEQTP